MRVAQNAKTIVLLPPVSVNGATAPFVLDTKGFKEAKIVFFCGVTGTGALSVCKLTEADIVTNVTTLDSGTVADISGSSLLGAQTTAGIDGGVGATAQSTTANGLYVWNLDLTKRKRFILPAVTTGGVTLVACYAVLCRPEKGISSLTDSGLVVSSLTAPTLIIGQKTI